MTKLLGRNRAVALDRYDALFMPLEARLGFLHLLVQCPLHEPDQPDAHRQDVGR